MKEGWTYKKLREVTFYPKDKISLFDIIASQYVGVETLVKDKGGVVFSANLPNAESATVFLIDDILIGNIRPYLKKIWKADRQGGASGDVVIVRIPTNLKSILSSDYLFKVLSSDKFFEYDNAYTHGAKMPRGDKNAISEYLIPIPPFPIQQSIVSELDKINELITLQKSQLKDLDALAQSIFYEIFGDPITNEKGWEVKKFGELGFIERGAGISKKDFVDNGLPCIHYGQLHTILGPTTKLHYTSIPKSLLPKYKTAHTGDLIMAITSEDVEGSCKSTAWLGNYDIVVGSDAAILHHEQDGTFLSYYTMTKAFFIEKSKYAKGFKVTHISTKEIENIPVYLPPLSLQHQFAERVEAIDRLKQQVQTAIKDLETLLASRMDYWFND